MRGAQRRAPQHVLGPHVRGVGELALDLRDAVRPPDRDADAVADRRGRAHASEPPPSRGRSSRRRRSSVRRLSTTTSPLTITVSASGRAPEHERGDGIVDARVVEVVEPPQHDVGQLADLERAELVLAAEAARRRAACRVPAPRRTSSPPARRAGARPAAPGAARRRAHRPRWTRRRRRPARPARPARTSGTTGAIPAPSRAFEEGQCATPVRGLPEPRDLARRRGARSARARRRRRASRAPPGTRPAARRTARGRTPPPRRSRPCGCAAARRAAGRTPRSRAISSRVTLNGEHGASAICSIEPGDGSWNSSSAAA